MCRLRLVLIFTAVAVGFMPVWAQAGQLKTAAAVLDRYKQAFGGVDAIGKVQSLTVHGEAEHTGMTGKATFIYYGKPFKTLSKVTRPDGTESTSGFDGKVAWS